MNLDVSAKRDSSSRQEYAGTEKSFWKTSISFPHIIRVLHCKLCKLGMMVGKSHLQLGMGKLLSLPSVPQPQSTRLKARLKAQLLITAQWRYREDKEPFLTQGTFPHYSWRFSVLPTLRKTAWWKWGRRWVESATKKITGLAFLLNCPTCSHLKAVVLNLLFFFHCS